MIDIEKAIRAITKEYGEQAKQALEESAEEVADETANELKSTSPKKTGRYAKGWKVKKELGASGKAKFTVHNTSMPSLTHLLERGHGLRSGGRTKALPHIKPAEENAIKRFEEVLRSKL